MPDLDRSSTAEATLRNWGRETELNPLDAMMWRTERPPGSSWAGIVVDILDSVPDWDRLVAAHERRIKQVPRFAERVVDPMFPTGLAMWSPDPHFDLSFHLRRVSLPAPGSMKQLLELAQTQAVVPFDRHRPPWVAILVEGLEGGRSAYLFHATHVLMDGGGATQLFSAVLGRTREPSPEVAPDIVERREISQFDATVRGVSRLVAQVPAVAWKVGSIVSSVAANPARAGRYAASMVRVVKPEPVAKTELLQGGSRASWRYGVVECELKDLKRAGKAVGGTVNDTFVAAILGGLRAYHHRHGVELCDLKISMPVSVRREGELGGNRFTGAFFAAPGATADPADRIRAMRERVAKVRNEPALDFVGTLTPLLNLAPSSVAASALQLVSNATMMTSSWPGLTEPTFVAGARLDKMFVFPPLCATIATAMCTHLGQCCIAITVDGDVFPDADVLWECMQQGLDEVLAIVD